eukprot:13913369-Alexandrium_andersonii.AAC.1
MEWIQIRAIGIGTSARPALGNCVRLVDRNDAGLARSSFTHRVGGGPPGIAGPLSASLCRCRGLGPRRGSRCAFWSSGGLPGWARFAGLEASVPRVLGGVELSSGRAA